MVSKPGNHFKFHLHNKKEFRHGKNVNKMNQRDGKHPLNNGCFFAFITIEVVSLSKCKGELIFVELINNI